MTGGAWRVDPTGRYEYRWWDGERYTEWVARFGEQMEDPAGIPDLSSTIQVGFGSPERQNRWTVGFRIVLAIPHLIWIALVTIAALLVLVVGWFAALFTARLPDDIARFLHRVLQYHVRLAAYLYLMRDDYPPFALSDERYPVVVETHPGTLNRWAVLFRLFLALPVLVLVNWLSSGLTVAMLVVWIVVLVKGRMPSTLAQAVAAVLRFEARTYGYAMLLSSEYPRDLYGDRVPDGVATAEHATEDGARPGTAGLFLRTGARRLVTLFLVLGILYSLFGNVVDLRVDGAGASVRPAAGTEAQPGQVARS